jgi:putative MATE family efflux protein
MIQPSLPRKIAFLAVPVALQCLMQAMLGMADVVMVKDLGTEAIAAVGLAAKLHFLLLVLMMGIASSSSILIAQFAGAKDPQGCQRTLVVALYWGAITTAPSVLAFLLGDCWLGWINPDPGVVRLATVFLLVTAPALLLTQIISVYEAALRATGKAMMPLVFGAGSVLCNVCLNYLLISGHWGFPALGVEGAAWGTLIARVLQLAAIWVWVHSTGDQFAPKRNWWRFTQDPHARRHFLRFSSPVVLNHAIWAVGNSTYHIATGFADTAALAVMGVMVPVESAFFALFIGLSSAAAVMIGQKLGANEHQEALHLYRLFDRLVLGLVLVFSLCLWLLRPWVIRIFSDLDAQTVELLMHTLTILCLGVWIKISNMLRILGVLRAGGDSHFCLVTDTIVMWVFGVPIFMLAIWLDAPFLVLYALMFVEDMLKWLPVKMRITKGYWIKNLTHDAELQGRPSS